MDEYFVFREEVVYGPYSQADVVKYVQEGRIALTDLARYGFSTDWVPLSRFTEITSALNIGTTGSIYVPPPQVQSTGTKSKAVALILCFFVGYFGVHRFYTGHVGLGILYIFTGGLCGIGVLIDFILLAVGSYKDSTGQQLSNT